MEPEARKPLLANPYLLLLCLFAAAGVVFRFVRLETVPPGVFVDEQAGMANVLCILRDGTSLYGKPWPLYFQALGGFYDPIFIYAQALFIKIFGASIASFRIFPSLCLLSACIGTAAIARMFLGREGAFIAFVISLFCPWSFHAGRLVWGSGLVTAFLPWGLFFLLRTTRHADSPKAAYRSAVLSGILLSCSASLYRPANAVIILLLAFLFVLRFPPMKVAFRYIFTTIAVLIVCGIPNIIFLSGQGWNRVDSLSIFGKEHMAKLEGSYIAALLEVLENYRKLFSWNFLFVSGDAIHRHTPASGALGWPECLGILCLAVFLCCDALPRRMERFFTRAELPFLLFCAGAVIIGLFPAAQSWDSNPHALRANAAWPFFVLLAAAGLTKLYHRVSIGPVAVCLIFSITLPLFLSHYFLSFPALGAQWFDVQLARTAKESAGGDWRKFGDAVKEYGRDGPSVFPMMYEGLNCRDALAFVERTREPRNTTPRVTIEFAKPVPHFRGELSTPLEPAP